MHTFYYNTFYFATVIDIGFEKERYNYTESINASACLTVRKFNNPPTLTSDINIRFLTMDGTAEGQFNTSLVLV